MFLRGLPQLSEDAPDPFLLFSEEQRTAILRAARQPGISLRRIRAQARIGNDSRRFAALKLWLEMNGVSLVATERKERVKV